MRLVLPFALAILAAGNEQPWKDKQAAEWTDDDAKLVMTSSPWARSVTPAVVRTANGRQRRGGGGRGMGGIGVGLPGIGGIGRRGGMGGGRYPGGGNPGGRPSGDSDSSYSAAEHLALRWESALPIQAAELKTHADQPTVEQGYYAIALYGIPNRMVNGDSKNLASELKKQAVIKREGKKNLKPFSVKVLQREDGAVIVYQFPKTAEITSKDKRIEFDAQIARFKIEESFYVEDMIYNGKLEL